MKRVLIITLLVLSLIAGAAYADTTGSGMTATEKINNLFAEQDAATSKPVAASQSQAPVAAAPAPVIQPAADAAATSAVEPAATNLTVDTSNLLVDESVFERNALGGYVSAHHAVEPWIAISARTFFPRLTLGINPGMVNNVATIQYYENNDKTQPQHTAAINFSNVVQGGYVDVIGLSGMEQEFSASPEVDLTICDWLQFSWAQLKGSGSKTTPLSVSVDGGSPAIMNVQASTNITLDLIGLQFLHWGFVKSNWIDLNLLAGVQTFWPEQYSYNYVVPLPGMQPMIGSGRAPFPIGTPYYGLSADLQFGGFTLTGSYAGLPGLDSVIANYTKVNVNYYVIQADLNYAFTNNISVDAGYRIFNLQPSMQEGFAQKWIPNQDTYGINVDNSSMLLRAEGPYGGITLRF